MSAPLSVLYRLTVPHPERHLCEVELSIRHAQELGDKVELTMAAWSPGSYLIRDYARYVRKLSVSDGKGAPRAVTKIRKDTWQVERQGADELVVRYEVYGHDLTVRTNHIDATHAFLHGPATFLFVERWRDRACRVEVSAPMGRGWTVATGLEPEGNGFMAANLDELLDCPIHMGPGPVRTFEAASVPVRLAVWNALDRGVCDLDQLVRDLAAIIEAHASRFGGLPFRHYTFILMLAPDRYGGLEHKNSSANLHTPFSASNRKSYEGLLELLSHEFFHVWNGKRLFPEAHSPFDYGSEAYTRCLWVMEGLTSYYDRYTLLRAGLQPAKRYLEKLADEWGQLLAIPGRLVQSLEEASLDAWIKLYKPDEFNVNSTVSYYLKGGLVALALDLLIRRQSSGARSLEDVLALLWSEYGETGKPYPENVQPLFERATGMELGGFFDRFVRGCEDPDLAAELDSVGLTLRPTWDPDQLADGREPVWLGVQLQPGSLRVSQVLDDGPAALAGLSPGDELLAIDGLRVTSEADLRQRLAARLPGDRVTVALFRLNRLEQVPVALVKAPPTRIEIVATDKATPEQRGAYASWLVEDYPKPGAVASANVQKWS